MDDYGYFADLATLDDPCDSNCDCASCSAASSEIDIPYDARSESEAADEDEDEDVASSLHFKADASTQRAHTTCLYTRSQG
jgi:hypothetical protein